MNKFILKLKHKMEIAKDDSDFAYFFSLLVAGEAITKLVTLVTTAVLMPDKDRHQYRILHGIVRANGIGDWSKAIEDLMSGTASQHLAPAYSDYQAEIIRKTTHGEWQFEAVQSLISALEELNIEAEVSAGKRDLKNWFRLFTELRNKTRGHGILPSEKASKAAPHLEKSISLLIENLKLLSIPTAYLKKNLSGKYRVTEISQESNLFDTFKTTNTIAVEDGIYLFLDALRKIPLITSDADLTDFYISNGGFNNTRFECLSYFTDDKKHEDSTPFLSPIGALPSSESEGYGELKCIGNVFTNVPDLSYEYIQRQELEDQLYSVLLEERRTIVTLLGRGGIGKTSLALRVIPRLYNQNRFDTIIWFSSRDIDLQSGGAKLVTANVVTKKDISKYYSLLIDSKEKLKEKAFDFIKYFQDQLTKSDIGPCLFVFDNFETTDNPIELFIWIDTYIRDPNKILITTRLREFKGDYPITVHGMTESESEELIKLTASHLKISDKISKELIENIYKASEGHPYIIKIMLGELSKNNMKGALSKIIAGSDEVLTALFERTYSALNPCAQRVFLTLASWNSAVSRLVLEAVLMISIDEPLEVEKAIDTLIQYSLAEEIRLVNDGQYFIALPFTAMSFGIKKLKVSPLKTLISSDTKLLQKFGSEKLENKNISLSHHISAFISSLDNPSQDYHTHKLLIERIGNSYVASWLIIARWLEESRDENLLSQAIKYLYLYLESEPTDQGKISAWTKIAELARKLKQPFDEVHALIEASQFSQVDFSDLSNIVNKVNHMLNTQELILENNDVKSELLSRVYDVVWKRKSEGDADDFSRLAWLALHLDKPDDAIYLVDAGLNIDNQNRHCLKLQQKLDK